MSERSPLPHLELELPGSILYLQTDRMAKHLAIECLIDDLPVFYLIDLEENSLTEELKLDEESKNVVLKDFTTDYILTQRFSDQNNPNSVEVFGFKWTDATPFLYLVNTKVLDHGLGWVEVPDPYFVGKTVKYDMKDGQKTKEHFEPEDDPNNVCYPTAYSSETEYFEWFIKILEQFDEVPIKSCEHLQSQELIFISYYTMIEQNVSNYLIILDKKGHLVERYLLDSGLKGIGKNTFFICQNQLIFVTGKQTLNVVEL